MLTGAIIIPRRNDIDGMGMQFTDVRPNSSDKNAIYDGPGQTGYLKWSLDYRGTTVTLNGDYVSGSLNTSPILADVPVAVAAPNDATATQATEFGLRAYLRDRVQADGAGGGALTPAEANTAANALTAAIEAGAPLTLAAVNAILVAAAGAGTELTSAGGSRSFGTLVELGMVLAGLTYKVPENTLITDNGGPDVFLSLTLRRIAKAGATVPATWSVSGDFVGADEPGYRAPPVPLVASSDVQGSAAEGMLYGFKQAQTFMNPAFSYDGADPTKPRARDINGTLITAPGTHPVIAVYDTEGNVL